MAHELDITNGVASFANSRPDAWHRLGTSVGHAMTGQEAMEAAHLANWNVRKMPLVILQEPVITPRPHSGRTRSGVSCPGAAPARTSQTAREAQQGIAAHHRAGDSVPRSSTRREVGTSVICTPVTRRRRWRLRPLFGWEFYDVGFATMIRCPGYGDHLEATVATPVSANARPVSPLRPASKTRSRGWSR